MSIHSTYVVIAAAVASLALGCGGKKQDRLSQAPVTKVRLPSALIRADDPQLIQYTLRFPERHAHYMDVEAVFPTSGDSLELGMAVWTPGSYLVREYSRHLEAVTAATPEGEPLAIEKTKKNRWRVETAGAARVVVRYRVYSRDRSVRGNYVDRDVAMLNGAPTFLTIFDDVVRPFDIALEVPEPWTASVTALPAHSSGAAHRYVAPDYDTVVDSPIVIGNPEVHEFAVDGVPHVLANFGGGKVWDGPRSAADTQAIAKQIIQFWQVIPYDRYVFLNVLLGSGGLEHKASTLMLASRFATRSREDYLGWLSLVSHEFFHTWNVKRMRPAALGPFDYETENYTPSLWIAEGITSYYDDLLVHRAGLMNESEYLERLSTQISGVQTTPGRLVQPLGESSFDAWIKYYRGDENSQNAEINYYRKGAVVGFLLDMEIRNATLGKRSLDDVMRLTYQRFSGERGFAPEDFRAVASEVAGVSLDAFFARAVDTTDELDYRPALGFYGLRFAPHKDDEAGVGDGRALVVKPAPGTAATALAAAARKEKSGYLGADVSRDGMVQRVHRDTPAYSAGLNPDDELLAIDGYRVTGNGLAKRLESYRPGDKVELLVAHNGELRRLSLELAEEPRDTWPLEPDPRADKPAPRRRARWLAGN